MHLQSYININNIQTQKTGYQDKCNCVDHPHAPPLHSIKNHSDENSRKDSNNGFFGAPLDKLEQLRNFSAENTEHILKKRAKRKYLTIALVNKLTELKSELNKSYSHTYMCGKTIEQKDGKLTSSYCGHRWCIVCGSIRTGKAINGYMPQLKQLNESYFVTLTTPNVTTHELRNEIKSMLAIFRQISDVMKKRGTPLKGLRKLECTHGNKGFHPHFHVIIEGKINAQILISEWLKRVPGSKRIAQDYRKADEGSMIELLKYATKLTAKSLDVVALDQIFIALKGKRTLQPFGGLKKVSEEITELDAVIETDQNENTVYYWVDHDWFSISTGEALTNFKPDALTLEMTRGYHIGKPPD